MFVPDGDGFVVATMLTQGPWDPNSQYGGTPAALLTWAVERVPTLVPMRIARITVDMHRRVPLGRLEVRTEIAREGKRLQVVVATISDTDGVEVARATALRFRLGEGPDAPTDPHLSQDGHTHPFSYNHRAIIAHFGLLSHSHRTTNALG